MARSVSVDRIAGEASSVLTITMPHVTVRTEQLPGSSAPGSVIYFRLVVVNDGSGLAKNVALVENLPEALQLVSTDPAIEHPGSSGSDQLTWRVSELAPGDTAVLRVGVRLSAGPRTDSSFSTVRSLSYEDSRGNVYRP
jgi:hypothetical protein